MSESESETYGCLVCDFETADWDELGEHHWTHSRDEWERATFTR